MSLFVIVVTNDRRIFIGQCYSISGYMCVKWDTGSKVTPTIYTDYTEDCAGQPIHKHILIYQDNILIYSLYCA